MTTARKRRPGKASGPPPPISDDNVLAQLDITHPDFAAQVRVALAGMKERPYRPQMTMADGVVSAGDRNDGSFLGNSALLQDAFATASGDFVASGIDAIVSTLGAGASQRSLNASLALLGAVEAKNELEAAIGVQIVAAHSLSLEMTRRAQTAQVLPVLQTYGSLAVKSQRNMALLVDALAKLRHGPQQRIKVEHVHVDARRQTVVQPGARGDGQNHGQPRERLALGHEIGLHWPEVRGQEPSWQTVPGASDQEPETLQAPWRSQYGRAEGGEERRLEGRGLDGSAGGPARAEADDASDPRPLAAALTD